MSPESSKKKKTWCKRSRKRAVHALPHLAACFSVLMLSFRAQRGTCCCSEMIWVAQPPSAVQCSLQKNRSSDRELVSGHGLAVPSEYIIYFLRALARGRERPMRHRKAGWKLGRNTSH